jgi:flavin reductase (DIM6/NTAB) family NADH-FMN oxidoreductase RutF
MPDVDPSVFRQLCGRFATGVSVVTTADASGRPAGMTANSFTSVSLTPPLISVCIDHRADMHARLLVVPRFIVNILEQHQEALSRRFATDLDDKFSGVGYTRTDSGLPILDGTLAWIECERDALIEAGDHTIVLGRVLGGSAGEGLPLLYYRGGYFDLSHP